MWGCVAEFARGRHRFSLPPQEHVQELTDGHLVQPLPTYWLVRMELIKVSRSDPAAGQVAAFHQIREDSVCCPLLDSHAFGDLADPDPRMASDTIKRMHVIRQKSPFTHATSIAVLKNMHSLTCHKQHLIVAGVGMDGPAAGTIPGPVRGHRRTMTVGPGRPRQFEGGTPARGHDAGATAFESWHHRSWKEFSWSDSPRTRSSWRANHPNS